MKSARASTLLLAAGLLAAGCDPTSSKEFTAGRSLNPCLEIIPACPGAVAACVLDQTQYAKLSFPGSFQFLVTARSGERIDVQMFFVEQRDAGLSTEIYWNEPGCSEAYEWRSEGTNLFVEAADTNVFNQARTVYETGEHLVEIFSDMNAQVLVTVEVDVAGRR